MEIKKKKLPLTTSTLRPKKAEEREPIKTQSISTSDLDANRKLRRAFVISQATDEELDRFFDEISPRIKFESEIIILRCSVSSCGYFERNRRRAIGTTCPQCSKKSFYVRGEVEENGKLEQASEKKVEAILAKEKAEAEKRQRAEKETQEAQAILGKAGFIPGRR